MYWGGVSRRFLLYRRHNGWRGALPFIMMVRAKYPSSLASQTHLCRGFASREKPCLPRLSSNWKKRYRKNDFYRKSKKKIPSQPYWCLTRNVWLLLLCQKEEKSATWDGINLKGIMSKILVFGHPKSDSDAIGSSVALPILQKHMDWTQKQ